MLLGQLDIHIQKKNEFGYYLTLHIKIDSEWNNLNIRAKTVILLEENIG